MQNEFSNRKFGACLSLMGVLIIEIIISLIYLIYVIYGLVIMATEIPKVFITCPESSLWLYVTISMYKAMIKVSKLQDLGKINFKHKEEKKKNEVEFTFRPLEFVYIIAMMIWGANALWNAACIGHSNTLWIFGVFTWILLFMDTVMTIFETCFACGYMTLRED
jgi:hypothetical protein